jgi:protein-S-isoprenylcysteine O-methyltransferase Ste14
LYEKQQLDMLMKNPSMFVDLTLLAFILIYGLVHLPLDLLMLVKKTNIHYPNPKFRNTWIGFFFIVPSLAFWFYLIIMPIISLVTARNFYTIIPIPTLIQDTLRIIGCMSLNIGLFVACLGRIGRGLYLTKTEPKLATNWGHSIVRHPSYFMYILSFVALPLLTLDPLTFWLWIGIFAYNIVAKDEETALLAHFGSEYEDYMLRVGRFFPKFKKKNKVKREIN